MRPATPLLLFLTAMLAGCAGEASSSGDDDELDQAFQELELEATDQTGIIRGIVVDESIRPVEGVAITLTIPGADRQSVTTSTAGTFGFDGLEPGTYFLRGEKFRHVAVQQSVEVLAGVKDPPIVKMLLVGDGSVDPYFSILVYDGYIECTTSFLVLCGLPNLYTGQQITNDRFTFTKFFQPNASLIQSEMTWESTQSLSPNLYFEMEPDGACDEGFFNRTEGPSPVYATLSGEQIADGGIDEDCGVYYSLFSGHNEPLPRQPVTGWGIGATVQQEFTMYIHSFYGFTPAAGWRFVADGDPVIPE